jgi:hypothetical protein
LTVIFPFGCLTVSRLCCAAGAVVAGAALVVAESSVSSATGSEAPPNQNARSRNATTRMVASRTMTAMNSRRCWSRLAALTSLGSACRLGADCNISLVTFSGHRELVPFVTPKMMPQRREHNGTAAEAHGTSRLWAFPHPALWPLAAARRFQASMPQVISKCDVRYGKMGLSCRLGFGYRVHLA